MSLDGSHWYLRDGSPCYEVPKAGGGMRPFNLRWDRKLGAVPSVTTILKILDKPALNDWRVRQGILSALTMPRIDGEAEDAYLARILSDSSQQVRDAADEGNRIHDAIECHFKKSFYPQKYRPHVESTVDEIRRLCPSVSDWVAEAGFAHSSGFGGRVDLHSPSTGIVIDFKGKDGDFTDGKRLGYDQHLQLGGYQVGLRLQPAPCYNIFVSRTHPGKVASCEWDEDRMLDSRKIFSQTLELWKLLKGYDPSF